MGEITDLFSGYLWRTERERMELARQTIVIGSGFGAKITMEKLLGRKPYPFLRTTEGLSVAEPDVTTEGKASEGGKPEADPIAGFMGISGENDFVDSRPIEVKRKEMADVKATFAGLKFEDEE